MLPISDSPKVSLDGKSDEKSVIGKYLVPFILVTSLFFLWAFLHNLNPILIPHLKKACQLSDLESALIDSSVYLGYFLMALPAGWFMHKYGYKKGILFGLLFYAIGTLMFLPAASSRSYLLFLTALFIIASGATFLETAGNPYITILGPKETSEQRLNLAQSFNGVGAVVAPLVGGTFILSGIEHTNEELARMSAEQLNVYLQSEADAVRMPYLIIAIIVAVVTFFFFVTKLPEVKESAAVKESDSGFSFKVLRHKHVLWAVIAQFFYIGAQVCVGSFVIRLSKFAMDMSEKQAAFLWGSVAMVGFMVGRFVGTFLMKYIKPNKLLTIFALTSVGLLAISLMLDGPAVVYAVLAVPFFMSIMFPTIFALGIKDLGEETKMASSLLIMSIVGGAILPLFMGIISDQTHSIQKAYIIPLFCFVVVAWYGWKGYKIKPAR